MRIQRLIKISKYLLISLVLLTNSAGAVGEIIEAWGSNTYGQLGDGTTIDRLTPVQVAGLINATAASAGLYHSLILKSDGTVWGWGSNHFGQLGDGTTTDRSTAVQVIPWGNFSGNSPPLTDVIDVAAGGLHSLALKSDGTVWAWGSNTYGQLGDGTTTDRSTAVQVSGLVGVTAVAAGDRYSLALKLDGTVWAWGDNAYGMLGDDTNIQRLTPVQVKLSDGSPLTNVIDIDTQFLHSFALRSDGTLWAWGVNYYGRLGDGTTTDRLASVQVSGLVGVTAVAAGFEHSIALKSDGTVWAWGYNAYGMLGDGSTIDSLTPVQVKLSDGSPFTGVIDISAGGYRSFALKPDGKLWVWGTGQLGDGSNTTVRRLYPVEVDTLAGTIAVSTNSQHSLTINKPFDFNLSASPQTQTLRPGGNAIFKIDTVLLSGIAQNVSFSITVVDAITNQQESSIVSSVSPSLIMLGSNTTVFLGTSSTTPAGTYNVIVTGASDSIHKTVIATMAVSNDIPVLSPIGNKGVTAGDVLTFTISATDADNDPIRYGTNATYGEFNTSSGKYSWTTTYDDVGSFAWYFNASDNYGGVDSETITVSVAPPTGRPSITILHPENNSIINASNVNITVLLNRSGSAQLNWENNILSMNGGPLLFYKNMTGLLSGNYIFWITATDSFGNSNRSDVMNISIDRTETINLPIDPKTGNVSEDIKAKAPSDNVTLKISNNTNASVDLISIDSHAYIKIEARADIESDNKFAGEILELGPAGATFNPDVQMIFNYTNEQLNQSGIADESKLTISYYNSSARKWENLKITERNATRNYIIGNTSHFSLFALAADLTPPPGVTDLKNTSFGRDYINWTWTDPIDASFDHTSIRIDGVFKGNVSKGVQFYNATGFEPDTSHTINVTTVDAYGNSNQTAVTNTSRTAPSESIYITIITPENNSENTTGNITIEVKLDRNGTAKLNWKGVDEPMNGSGMNFSSNKTGVLSGNFSFRVYANDSTTTAVSETRNIRVNRTIESKFIIGESGNTTGDYSITLPSNNTTVTLYNGTNISIVDNTGQLIDCGSEKNISVDSLDIFSYEISSRLIKNRFAGENFTVEPVCARNMSGVHIRFIPDAQIRINYTDAELAALHVTVNDFMVKYYDEINQTWSNLNITYRGDTYIIVNVSYLCSIAKVVPTVAQMLVMQAGSSTVEPGTLGVVSAEPADNIIDYEIHGNNLVADKSIIYKYVKGEKGIYEIAAMSNKNESNVLIRVEYLKNLSKKVNEPAPEILHYYTNIWSGSTNIKESVIRFKEENSWIDSNKLTRVKMLRFDGGKWTDPGTKQISKDEKYTYFETKSNGFSSFAIIGVKPEPTPGETEVVAPSPSILVTSSTKDVKPPNWDIILLVLAVVLIIAILVVAIPALKAKPIQIKSIPTEPFMVKQPAEYGEKYNEHLFEQYKQYVDMVDKLNQRQRSNDTGYLIIASLFGVLSGLESLAKQQIWPFLVPFTGLLISIKWLTFTYKYRQLNLAKLSIIYELESQLPAALYASEWKNAWEGKTRSYLAIEFIEQVVPWIFAGIFFIYIIVRLNQM